MADEQLKRDPNHQPVMGAVTDDAAKDVVQLRVDPTTKRVKVETGDKRHSQIAPVVANDSDANTTGVKATYTAPAGKTARCVMATLVVNVGTPTVQLRLNRGGTVIVLGSYTAQVREQGPVLLEPADVIDWNVSAAGGASSTIDVSLHIDEEI